MVLFYSIQQDWMIIARLKRDDITILSLRYLKPDVHKKSKHKTAVIKKTLNPEFNEVDIHVCVRACV